MQGLFAAVGLREVAVYRQPRVAVISTGSELVEPGQQLPGGKISRRGVACDAVP
jgi:molybdopterin molybdotransferase